MKSLAGSRLTSSSSSLFAACTSVFLLSGLSLANEEHQHDKADMAKKANINIERAIHSATEKVPGTVTKAELESEHGPLMWEIEIVTKDGEIVEVHLNALDGQIIDH